MRMTRASRAPDKQLYRIADAMIVLSMSRSVIYEQIRSGRLRSVNAGPHPADPCIGDRRLRRTPGARSGGRLMASGAAGVTAAFTGAKRASAG